MVVVGGGVVVVVVVAAAAVVVITVVVVVVCLGATASPTTFQFSAIFHVPPFAQVRMICLPVGLSGVVRGCYLHLPSTLLDVLLHVHMILTLLPLHLQSHGGVGWGCVGWGCCLHWPSMLLDLLLRLIKFWRLRC